jgi:hypothetical protein
MNRKPLYALVLIVLLLTALVASNPGVEKHRLAVLSHKTDGAATLEGGALQGRIGKDRINRFLGLAVKEEIQRQNYGIFSLTKYSPPTPSGWIGKPLPPTTIGIGILGRVYLWTE